MVYSTRIKLGECVYDSKLVVLCVSMCLNGCGSELNNGALEVDKNTALSTKGREREGQRETWREKERGRDSC